MIRKNTKAAHINGTLVREARLAMNMGAREFVRESGTGSFIILRTIERDDTISTSTTIAELMRLADLTGVTVSALLEPPNRVLEHEGATHLNDVQRLCAVLIGERRHTPLTDIAYAFGWTLKRTRTAVEDAEPHLRTIGLRIHDSSSTQGIALRPLDTEADTLREDLDRRRTAKSGMNITEVRMLRDAYLGTMSRTPKHNERPRQARLVKLGILRPGTAGEPQLVLSDEAREAYDVPTQRDP